MNIVIAYNHIWYEKIVENLKHKLQNDVSIFAISKKENLTVDVLNEINPTYVFFPHWSYIIPADIYNNFECVIFHMTDVPFGRGGSPLQNLISRGIYQTKITALRCSKVVDGGPVYLKKDFSLYGNAEEIYVRASAIIELMIGEIINNKPTPKIQKGNIVEFSRRTPSESNINLLGNLVQVFDYIRMLDADGYPPAYIENDFFKFEFNRASLKDGYIHADVKIIPKEK